MGTQIHAERQLPPRRRADPERARSARCARRTSGSSRAWGLQSEEDAKQQQATSSTSPTGRRKPTPVPPDLDWDLWLGPAPARPFHDGLCSRAEVVSLVGFRQRHDERPRQPLERPAVLGAEAASAADDRGQRPAAASGDRPGLDERDLRIRPARRHAGREAHLVPGRTEAGDLDRQAASRSGRAACLFIGDKGMLLSDYSKHVLLPEKRVRRTSSGRRRRSPEVARPPRRMDSTPARPARRRRATSSTPAG